MTKNINVTDGVFTILYFDKLKDISEYIYNKNQTAINIEFVSRTLNEKECIDYANSFKQNLIKEIEMIISENGEFYKYFDFYYDFSFTIGNLDYSDISSREPNIITCTTSINCKLKNPNLLI